jgi:hypothetical protein
VLQSAGLSNTRILNRVYSWQTKQTSPEGIRYGIGVSTPEDMVSILEKIHRRELVDSASSVAMLNTLSLQQYNEMIPKYLPYGECRRLDVAHKTGSLTEVKVDVALISSERADIALAVFVDKQADHSDGIENSGIEFGARTARLIWDAWASPVQPRELGTSVDWTSFPGGRWGVFRTSTAPFPHAERHDGFRRTDGTTYPYFPHYADSSVVVVVPAGLKPVDGGINLIVHFHGHGHDNLDILEHSGYVQAMLEEHINAVLVLPHGPFRARDSFGGKMEDTLGLKNLCDAVMKVLVQEKSASGDAVGSLVISAHSGGYRPAAYSLARGGMREHVASVFLFDALYAQAELFESWLEESSGGTLHAAFTPHLEREHAAFQDALSAGARTRAFVTPAGVEHEDVVPTFVARWLRDLGPRWKMNMQ